MGKKYSTEEERVIEKVIEETKKLVKKYGYEHTIVGMQRYIVNTKAKKKLLGEIKARERDLEELKDKL